MNFQESPANLHAWKQQIKKEVQELLKKETEDHKKETEDLKKETKNLIKKETQKIIKREDQQRKKFASKLDQIIQHLNARGTFNMMIIYDKRIKYLLFIYTV